MPDGDSADHARTSAWDSLGPGLVHPTILQLNGSPMVEGNGITDLCIRVGVAISPTHVLTTPFAAVLPGMIVGALGAVAAQFASGCREGFRKSTK